MQTQTFADQLISRIPELKDPLAKLEVRDGKLSAMPEDKHVIAIMGLAGDHKLIWDPNNEAEVEAARATFNTLTKKGYTAFRVTGKEGEKGDQMREFDPNAGRMVLIPMMRGGA